MKRADYYSEPVRKARRARKRVINKVRAFLYGFITVVLLMVLLPTYVIALSTLFV